MDATSSALSALETIAMQELVLDEDERRLPLGEQYHRLLRGARSEAGATGYAIWYDAQRWVNVSDAAAEGATTAYAHAHQTIEEEKKGKTEGDPEFAPDAETRLGKELHAWSKKVANLWEGKAYLSMRSYRSSEGREIWMVHLDFHKGAEENGVRSDTRDDDLHRDFIELLEAIGETGKQVAKDIGGKSPWDDDNPAKGLANRPLWATALGFALWYDRVRPEIEAETKKPPGVVFVVHEQAIKLLGRVRLAEEKNGQRALHFSDDEIVTVDASLIDEALRGRVERGFKLFGTTTSHRVFRHLVISGHRQTLQFVGDPRVLNIDGGYAALAHDHLGLKGTKCEGEVRDIVEAMHVYEIPIGKERERVLIRKHTRGAGRKAARLEIILGFPLLPNYVQELQRVFEHRLEERLAKRIVPILDCPPTVGRERDHGAQFTFQMAIVQKMRQEGENLIRLGGARLDEATLEQLATMAGLPLPLIGKVLDRWTQDGDDGPAQLQRVSGEKNVYRLGASNEHVWNFMVSGAKKEADGRRWAQKGQAAKARKIAKRGK